MTIDLNLSEDQRQILDAARNLLEARFPIDRLRNPGADPMEDIAAFGALGLALPEEAGGSGFGVTDEVLLHVEFGRHLVTPAALAGAIAARAARELGLASLMQRIIAGDARVALALRNGDDLTLLAPGGAALAVSWGAGSASLLDLSGAGLSDEQSIDDSLRLARSPADALPFLGSVHSPNLALLAELLVAAQLLGMAEATRDMAVGYAGVRQQFGQPIGAFQAVKHHCANMAIATEIASAQLSMAALVLGNEQPDAAFQVASAGHLAQRAALGNARLNIQIHGGFGFSAECDAHLFLKRAHAFRLAGTRADLLAHTAPLTHLTRS
ncbi:MAG: acyl-CoA dehydrogenase family protein [Pararhodobacter sp.]|nr:acyl-CoA dehydrogenase family protein [Pararhodobacter sp.]